jgi:hypothetical protein
MSSGKFHGMTWPATPSGRGRAEAGVLELVGPAGVVEEVRRGERDVDVAALRDRLAVVERLEDGELAGALLDDPRDAEEVLGALAPGIGPRRARSAAGGGDGAVDVRLGGERDLGQDLLGGGLSVFERRPRRVDELAVDEEAVGGADVDDRRDSGAGAYSNRAFLSVQGQVVGGGVGADLHPAALQQQVVEQAGGADRKRSGSSQSGPAVSLTSTRCLTASFAVRMPPAGLTPTTAPVARPVADGLEQEQRDRQRRGRRDLAGAGLDEVGAGQHREPGGAADVVVRPSSPVSRMTLRCASPHALLDARRSPRRPAGSGRRGTRRGR